MNVFRKDNQRQINIKTCIEYCEINGDFWMKTMNKSTLNIGDTTYGKRLIMMCLCLRSV
jgi:hypothetical protein